MDNLGASFFTFLANPTLEMQVPSEFVKRHGEILKPKIELKTDDQRGKSWEVETERVGKRCFLTKGWSEFAEDVELVHGDCVVFTFLGDFAFDVSIYGDHNTCKKMLPPTEKDSGKWTPEKDDGCPEKKRCKMWKFCKEMKYYSFQRMTIPKKFVISTGIIASRKMQLVDGRGRKWPVTVTDRNKEIYAMSGGLIKFMTANKVAVGNKISFEFIPNSGNTVEALVIPADEFEEQEPSVEMMTK